MLNDVSRATFENTVNAWTDDVRKTALRLFDEGIPHDYCVNIAMKLVEGRDIAKARAAVKFMGHVQ